MKRGAERQITNVDDPEDDEIQETTPPAQGFTKADDAVLASRPMRGMPKRSTPSATPPPSGPPHTVPASETLQPPKFTGFGGFGATSGGGSQPSPLGIKGSSAPPPPGPQAAASSAPTAAAKAFTSFLNTPQSTPSSPGKTQDVDKDALKYYTSLRGLNVSYLTAIKKAVDEDPFADIKVIAERYNILRVSIQKDFDDALTKRDTTKSKSPPASGTNTFGATKDLSGFGAAKLTDNPSSFGPSSTTTTSPFGAQPKPPSSMPAPPATFAGFKPLSTPSSSPASGGGFSPKLDDKPSGAPTPFSFIPPPGPTTSTDSPSQKDEPPAPSSSTTDAPKPSPFGATASPAKPPVSNSLFGAGASTPTPSPFGSSIFSSEKKDAGASPSPFGTGTSQSVFGTNPSTSAFGTGTSPSPFGGGDSKSSSFTFGASKPAPATPSFGRAPSGSFGNPVGFGFGGSGGSGASTPSGGFAGFGTPSKTDDDDEGAGGEDDAPKLLPTQVHDEEGEGEEDEETTHAVKAKVYKLAKDKDGANKWADMGVGTLRLKKHKETSARRVLLRNSSTGKITINFNIYNGLSPSLTQKFVTFVGHEEGGASATFKLRVKTDEQASELKAAMDREIAALGK